MALCLRPIWNSRGMVERYCTKEIDPVTGKHVRPGPCAYWPLAQIRDLHHDMMTDNRDR